MPTNIGRSNENNGSFSVGSWIIKSHFFVSEDFFRIKICKNRKRITLQNSGISCVQKRKSHTEILKNVYTQYHQQPSKVLQFKTQTKPNKTSTAKIYTKIKAKHLNSTNADDMHKPGLVKNMRDTVMITTFTITTPYQHPDQTMSCIVSSVYCP